MFYIIGLSLLVVHIIVTMIVGSQDLNERVGKIELDLEVEQFLNRNKSPYEY
jgi:hypothetical protein